MTCCEYSIVHFMKCVIPTKIHNDRRINLVCVLCWVALSCLTLCDPMDWSPPGSSVRGDSPGNNTGVGCHALLQVIFPPRDQTQVSHIAGGFFTVWATREAQISIYVTIKIILQKRSDLGKCPRITPDW